MKKTILSRINEVLSGLIDLVLVGIYWLVCSLPFITLGASSTALYHTVVKCIRHNRGDLSATFFRCFRQNFRLATLSWLLILAYLFVFAADAYALDMMGIGKNSVLHILSRIMLLPPLFFFPWIFSYLSRFDNTLKGSLKFCAWLMLRNPLKSLLLALELAGFSLVSWLLPMLFPLLPAPVCLLMSITIESVFRRYQADVPDDGSVDNWYNE